MICQSQSSNFGVPLDHGAPLRRTETVEMTVHMLLYTSQRARAAACAAGGGCAWKPPGWTTGVGAST